MALILLLALGALTALAVVVAVLLALAGRLVADRPTDRGLRRVRLGLLCGLATGGVVLVALLALGTAVPSWLGLPLAVAPGLATAAGLLVFAAVPAAPVEPSAVRTASLDTRGPLTVGDRRAYLVPAALGTLLAVLLVLTGATGAPDEAGRLREYAIGTAAGVGTAGPYPGWYYALPLLLTTALVVGATMLALRRIAALPSVPGAADGDRMWRRDATAAVSLLTSAGLLLHLTGVLAAAGEPMLTVGLTTGTDAARVGGTVLLALAPVALVAACVLVVRAAVRAVTVRAGRPVPAARP
ncbi:hypothetical protein QDR37_11175 [Amnibacterium sp. CER49]|uniref:hypothetical protein n=1 Tax=Amnibacterium sp. CER49 TaxID=3039161 RepID=UPI00244AD205|nr:hypothetical protein [Amnibacterium sp. CER49]MDH2444506.1 hypothetical protein [Amnibacterium sp. CER49]